MKVIWLFTCISFLAAAVRAAEVKTAPAPGETYRIATEFPKHVTADIEFRDAKQEKWPSFFYGRAATTNGFIKFDPSKPEGSFVLVCDARPQKNGDQSRRVLGELFSATNDAPGVTLRINSVSAITAGDAGGPGTFRATLAGVLEVKDRKVPVNAPATLRYHPGARSDERNEALMVQARFKIKAGDLGLKSFASGDVIFVRAGFTAYSEQAVASGGRRKPL